MNEPTSTPTHASVLYLRLGDITTKAVIEQARMRAQLEAVAATGLSVLPQADRIVLDTPDGIALVVLDNALGALKAAERCLDAAAVLPLCIGAGHGAVATVDGNGTFKGMIGDGLHSAAVAAGFATPSQLLATRAFREAVTQQEPVRQADLVRAGMFADASVRTHELFVMDRLARRRRRRRLTIIGAGSIVAMLIAGMVGRLAYRQEGPFAPKAVVALNVTPGSEVFLDGRPQGATPPLASLAMPAGAHVVEIRHAGNSPFRQELQLKPGERVELAYFFSPLPQLTFEVSPGGELFVDGTARGAVAKVPQLELAEGTHSVEIRYPGYPPYLKQVTLKRGERLAIKYAFNPAMLVFRIVPGGHVFVNGRLRGKLPDLERLELVPGHYVIEVRYLKFEPFTRTVDLQAGQQVVIQYEFKNFLQRFFRGK